MEPDECEVYGVGMIEGSLEMQVSRELELAGLRPYLHDGSRSGGFGVQLAENGLHVVWTPSGGMSDAALSELERGDDRQVEMRHLGTVKHAMADAILQILVSRGMSARLSSDDMLPATVEVTE